MSLDDLDNLTLDARLRELRIIQAKRPRAFVPPPGMPDELVELSRKAWDEETASLVREQLTILSKLRRTSAGPARKGGTRAKKAPLDLGALISQLAKRSA